MNSTIDRSSLGSVQNAKICTSKILCPKFSCSIFFFGFWCIYDTFMITGCKLHELLPSSLKDRSKFFGSVCAHCNEVIQPNEKFFRALGCIWHMNHFRCFQCNADLQGEIKWVTQFSIPAPKFRPFCPPKRVLWVSFLYFGGQNFKRRKFFGG